MRIEHVALWTFDIERLRAFYERVFDAQSNARYESRNTEGFASYFLTFPGGGARLELMQLPVLEPPPRHPACGYAHLAISVGSREKVDTLTEQLRRDGVAIRSAPRETGDGYYEAVVEDPDGNWIEITV